MRWHRNPWARRLAWLVGLWAAGVAVVLVLAQVLKSIMRLSGLG